jgi:hypothetical protein
VTLTPARGEPVAAVASAPGRLLLCGTRAGAHVSVALDRRAICRVEPAQAGLVIESKDALTRTQGADASELVSRASTSIAAQAVALAGATRGLRVVTEWKLPERSGVDGDAALALATVAAVSLAIGREPGADELLRLSREAARRAGRQEEHGHHAALWGGVVVTGGRGGSLEAKLLAVDPARVEEALLLVDAGEVEAGPGPDASPAADARAEEVAAALVAGRSEELLGLLAGGTDGASSPSAAGRVILTVRAAGGAAWRLPNGRLVGVWAPPGARGHGVGEAVRQALQAAGFRALAIRVDLRGLELD